MTQPRDERRELGREHVALARWVEDVEGVGEQITLDHCGEIGAEIRRQIRREIGWESGREIGPALRALRRAARAAGA